MPKIPEEITRKHGTNIPRALRRAIREEIGGAPQLLDLLTTVHQTRQRLTRGERLENPQQLLTHIEETLIKIKEAMIQDLLEMYEPED